MVTETQLRGLRAWAETQRAATECPYGHGYDGFVGIKRRERRCRQCRARRSRDYRARQNAKLKTTP